MVARAHVVFTTDGKTIVDNKDRMHAMRRRFCKSWWNDRWRDLLLAYTSWLPDGKDAIELPVGSKAVVTIGGAPLLMMAPVSLAEEGAEDEAPDEITDELDLGGPEDENDPDEDLVEDDDAINTAGAS